jgi:hypothetical protein
MEKTGRERGTEGQAETKKQQNTTPDQVYNMTRERAFEIYSQHGNDLGDSMADWLAAEREIKRKLKLK